MIKYDISFKSYFLDALNHSCLSVLMLPLKKKWTRAVKISQVQSSDFKEGQGKSREIKLVSLLREVKIFHKGGIRLC